MDEARFEFLYDLTAEDVAAATRWSILAGPRAHEYTDERRRAGRTLLWFALVLGGLAATFILLNLPAPAAPPPSAGFLAGIVGGLAAGMLILHWAFFSPRATRRAIEHAIRTGIARESGQAMLGATRARFDAEGCSFDRPLGDSLRRWIGVLDCAHAEPMIYFTTLDQQVLGLPTRVFRDTAHRDEFLSSVRRWINARGAAAIGRVTAHLRDHDLPCPQCGYNLRGVTVMTCPECAASLARVVLPDAQRPGRSPAAAGSTAPAPPTPRP